MKRCTYAFGVFVSLFLAVYVCNTVAADSLSAPENSEFGIQNAALKQSGFVGIEAGQVMQGAYYPSQEVPLVKVWQQRLLLQLVNNVSLSDRMKVIIAIEGQLNYSYPQSEAWPETKSGRWSFYPDRAEGTYTFGDISDPYLQVGFGYFPFRTNPDIRNLGEFLFRSGTYPVFVINSFNRPYARLLGFRASSKLLGSLHQDLLLTSEYALNPVQDWSLSYLVSYNAFSAIDIGAGVSFARIFAVDEKLTSQKDPGSAISYQKQNGELGYYTFKGTKPMVRLTIDPKILVPSFISQVFKKEDLRIYGEACVSGWTNYKNYDTLIDHKQDFYDNREDRTMYMFGMNVPTYKLIDVLSLEFEHFPNRYPNSYVEVYNQTKPIPLNAIDRNIIPWKWSLYAKKTFLKNYALIGQVARDHFVFTNSNAKFQIKEDVLTRPGDWWWVLRLNATF